MSRFLLPCLLLATLPLTAKAQTMNLLLNPQFDFHCFDNSRNAQARAYAAGYVACWNAEAYGDVTVTVAGHVESVKPRAFTRNIVALKPGKHFYQVMFLPDVQLRHGDVVSLSVCGQQKAPDSLRASVHVLKIDSQTGKWKPSDFGMADQREFPKHSRGELVKAKSYTVTSGADNDFALKLEQCQVVGTPPIHKNESSDEQINSIALMVEFENLSKDADVLIYAPALVKGAVSVGATTSPAGREAAWPLPELRPVPTMYRQIPRTIRKLWRGEPLHIILMGSSIDRASANPPMYPYDEDPASPKYKQPLAQDIFNGELIGRPDLTATVGRWQHYYSWGGRLRTELLRKFNYTPDKLLLNYMACDGSCISEATSGLAEYASLALPPNPETNGQPAGKTWQEMYPGLFDRPQGPGPDLVLFGSGANEKTDMPEEGAIFEASIRFLQERYPDCEFIFCMWQNLRGYTPNTGHLMELALSYQIPFVDMGDRIDQLMGYANRYALCPSDGHPQAAGHTVWFKSLEQAFEVADPIAPGIAQRHLPQRLYPTSYGWEGEIVTYSDPSPRLVGNMMVLDDTTVNAWGSIPEKATALIDGEARRTPRTGPTRNIRNSLFTYGKLSLGDRHVLELTGEGAKLTAADCKICPDRRSYPMDNPAWTLGQKKPEPFASQWGAPFGDKQVKLQPGESLTIHAAGTDLAVAYVDDAQAGKLKVTVDDAAPVEIAANVPYKDATGKETFMENRQGFRNLGYGLHAVRIEAVDGPVAVLGLFAYDTRSGQVGRRVTGLAQPGETIRFTPPFKVRPLVLGYGGLAVKAEDISTTGAKFSGAGPGTYEALGEW
jgi:hypothetical protein